MQPPIFLNMKSVDLKIICFIHILLPSIHLVKCFLNNACKSYQSYMNIYFSSDCYYIPDNYDDVLEIISRHTGVGETHNVTTEDGYILSLFRIPQNNPKDVILFQHGIIQDSQQWVTQYNESVAFLFWKAGYDVWLGNSRGNFYSKKHITLTPKDEKFWDYSFNEIGYYDNNATIEYIKSTTNAPKIIYLGFSMGATSGLVYASMRPEDATNSVKVMISLAPVSFMKYLKTPLKTMFSFSHFLMTYELHKVLRWYSLFNHNSWHLCILRCFNRFFPFKQLFIYVIEYIAGWTSTEIDPNYFNLMMDKFGSETSMKNVAHYYQVATTEGKFQMYDYGSAGNLKHYGTESPPSYPVENISTPIFIVHSEHDIISQPEDVELLYSKLSDAVKIYGKQKIKGLNHQEFLFSKERNEKIYNNILEFLNQING